MKKLLKLFDDNILRFGVAFAILFTALYPKLPSVHVVHTWVYIRLEDFLILLLAFIWLVQLLRKKISFPRPEGYALILYWVAGLVSLVYCLIFVAPHLIGFFPSVAFLEYARRIEYMILFFIAFGSVKNVKDVYFFLTTLCVTVFGIIVYGFGQRFYFLLWNAFPHFFQKNPFCFPAFLTGNEEFAKGTPLCLNDTSRITSTFGGHYDLAAYLVFIIPILIALVFAVKRWYLKVIITLLAMFGLELLNFTSSRTSFAAYVIGVIIMLVVWKKKWWIAPILAVSLCVMLLFGNATIARFSKTLQPVQVVTSNTQLPANLQNIISSAKKADDSTKPEVPPASDLTVGASQSTATGGSKFTTVLTDAQVQQLKNEDVSISTESGSFLISKAYALDVSFTTRFQAEWPRNWNAFIHHPIFGTGYSSLTLATDNDYLRAMGETGLVGTLAFLFMFVMLGVFMKMSIGFIKDDVTKAFLFGLVGGVVGLLINGILIDVFEASKVAEPFWILTGIAVGAAGLYQKEKLPYKKELFHFFTSKAMIGVYLLLLILTAYVGSIGNFFVGDDFTWLRWAASATPADLPKYFISSPDFFYRPLDKTIIYFLYSLFSFQPQGYHIFNLLLHFLAAFGVYLLIIKLVKNKLVGFLAAVLFAILPAHTENIFWFSTISITLSTVFIVYAMLSFIVYREKNSFIAYVMTVSLSALAFVSYEMAVVLPFLLLAYDSFFSRSHKSNASKLTATYTPFIMLLILYFIIRYVSHAFSGGGDYSYNITHFIPNVIGNFIGYTGLFLGGIPFLSLYETFRNVLRTEVVLVSLALLILFGILGYYLYKIKKDVHKALTHPEVRTLFFGFVFAFISLLPFLPLGNITSRYLYLASIGYALTTVFFMHMVLRKLITSKRSQSIAMILIVAVLVLISFVQNNVEQQKWQQAGQITKQTLTFFRTGYAGFSPNDNLFFINTPVQRNGVWVFPVGLNDGIWFIYRSSTPHIYQNASLQRAQTSKLSDPTGTYIFQFTNGIITEVK